MLTIALTGGIACGKSTVANLLRDLGASIVDADGISRSLTAPNGAALPAIREAFGGAVFHADGTLDRAALGALVFDSAEALETLNAITHPLIEQEMGRQREACRNRGAQIVVLDVPLLFEANMQHLGDIVVCVHVPQAVQLERLMARDGFTPVQARSRIRSQMPTDEKAARSDIVIDNNRPLPQVEEEVRKLYEGWLSAARKENE